MFRLDRLLTLGLIRPLMRMKLNKRSLGIPILMYHSVSEDLQTVAHPYFQTTTTPNTFRRHMAFLQENGYTVLPLKDAVGRLQHSQHFNGKLAVLTFDDGFKDFYTEAFPVLHDYGYPSTVFLATAFVDDQRLRFRGRSCLSWEEIRQLHCHGVAFGAHTVNHPELVALGPDELRAELELSRRMIESELGEDVESFAYPFAFPEDDTQFITLLREQLQAAGYHYGVTTKIGISDGDEDPLFLKRIPVGEHDDLGLLKAKLDGAYNWLHPLQRLFKNLKGNIKQLECKSTGNRGAPLSAPVDLNPRTGKSSTRRQHQRAAV